jgi:hypothetical protein
MAEHSAVNRRVVGSSPTCGAILDKSRIAPSLLLSEYYLVTAFVVLRLFEDQFK